MREERREGERKVSCDGHRQRSGRSENQISGAGCAFSGMNRSVGRRKFYAVSVLCSESNVAFSLSVRRIWIMKWNYKEHHRISDKYIQCDTVR